MKSDPVAPSATGFSADESCAVRMDREDPLRGFRERFHIPRTKSGEPAVYLCGNSLGLQPTSTATLLAEELEDWRNLAVEGHFAGRRPWYSYHEMFREPGARLVGALPGEVVMMNSLTVNLHLMMVSFYRPDAHRFKILIDHPTFPSDTYAAKSQIAYHGFDPAEGLMVVKPRAGEHTIRTEDVEHRIEEEGDRIALVLFSGVNFFTGQLHDMPRIAAVARRNGCLVGFDLAHAAGNVELALHDWNVDFAAWCSYKYVNSGPGAVAGCFVHERHGRRADLPRFAGWWGNDPQKRFLMHLLPDFEPREGADGWQVSNPPIMALAPVKASLDLFEEAGMAALRAKSQRLTRYLEFLLDATPGGWFEVITPREPAARGCQLSILVHDRAKERFAALQKSGVMCDFREPNVVRVAPVPLYNSFHDVWRFARVLALQS